MSENSETINLSLEELYDIVINSKQMNYHFIVDLGDAIIFRVSRYLVAHKIVDGIQQFYNIAEEKNRKEVLDIINPYLRRKKIEKINGKI